MALSARDQVPEKMERFTPAEIATWANQKFKDERLLRFVNAYYYPLRYGELDGAMLEADAEALVMDLERRMLKPGQDSKKLAVKPQENPPAQNCQLCGQSINNESDSQ